MKAALALCSALALSCCNKTQPDQITENNPDNQVGGGANPTLTTITANTAIERLQSKGWQPSEKPRVTETNGLKTTVFPSRDGITILFEEHSLTENALASLERTSDSSEVAKARRGNTIIRVLVSNQDHRLRAQQALRDIEP